MDDPNAYVATARITVGGAIVAALTGLVCLTAAIAAKNIIPALVGLTAAGFIAQLQVQTTVDGEALTAAMRPFSKKRIPLADINLINPERHSWLHGIGYRWLGSGTIGLLVGGPEASIEYGAGKCLRISHPDPERLIAEVQRRRR